MKKQLRTNSFYSVAASVLLLSSITFFTPACKKEKSGNNDGLPGISNAQAVKSFQNSDTVIIVSANITSDGGNAITERGFVYSTNQNPSLTDNVEKSAINSTGTYADTLVGLNVNTQYYVRAYATNSKGTVYSDQVNFFLEGIKIGSRFGGGIVFYVDGTGQHGLITARNGLGYTGSWGCEGTAVPGTQAAVGTGEANTTLIASSCSTAGIAARFCLDLVYNGYDDWFLPSKDELNLMYLNRNLAVDLFSDETRWSSTQNDNNTGWAQEFDADGGQKSLAKGLIHGARAVRAF